MARRWPGRWLALVGVDRPDAAGAVFQAATLLVPAAGEQDDAEATNTDPQPAAAQPVAEPPAGEPGTPFTGSAAIATGSYRCRYAGAMMLIPLPEPGRRPSDLRDVDRWPGPPVRRPVRADHRDPGLRVGCRHGGGRQAPAPGRGSSARRRCLAPS